MTSETRSVEIGQARDVTLRARQNLRLSILIIASSETAISLLLLSSSLALSNCLEQGILLEKAMSINPRARTSRSTALPRLQPTTQTETANALTERVFQGKKNQSHHDTQTYFTTIVSANRATSVFIVLTLDDSLASLKAYAHRKIKIPLAEAETTKMYMLWSKKVFYAIGVHPVSENSVLLDQDTLNTILTFMKASPQLEQLLVQFEADIAEVVAKWEREYCHRNESS